MLTEPTAWLACASCAATFAATDPRVRCDCGGLLGVARPSDWHLGLGPALFDARLQSRAAADRSGVWRFREGVLDLPVADLVTRPEGCTPLYRHPRLSAYAGLDDVSFKHEGENPTGSFKDRGMTVAISQARRLGARAVACASTGNTSAALAAYAAQAQLKAVVFLPEGKISSGKLAQTRAYGATCLQIRGDFDAAMALVIEVCDRLGIYLVNSINPFRLEGQKTIVWDLLQDRGWTPPDWIALPAGNLGNTSAFGKALAEAKAAGWISHVPRLAAVQAAGANPFYLSFQGGFVQRHSVTAQTVASAIRIGNPVSYERARAAIAETNGVVCQVSDAELLAAKREIDAAGVGCEPASACALAGVRQLRAAGTIGAHESVVCVLTGHLLKDPDAGGALGEALATPIDATLAAAEHALRHL